jgi:hypothetical protein
MSKKTMLTVFNSQINECGDPPKLEAGNGKRTCYFENQYGEQNIIQYDPEANIFRLWMGDVGWEEELHVEEFRGHPIVLFARSPEERKRDFRMNKQFEWQSESGESVSPEEKLEIEKLIYKAWRKIWGKPRLTDAECERLSHTPTLNQYEMDFIRAFWNTVKYGRGEQ